MPFLFGNEPEEDVLLEPIAICGMACRLPGKVSSPSSLWDLLVNKGHGSNSKVPKTRFNIDAYLHPNNDRPGSFNVPGGYFIDGPAENFDPTFFNITPVEAMWLDPQQRKMLEVCYEAMESAGVTLDEVSGSNTGVFVGSFTADYQQMTFKDPDFRHSYAATGVDPGIISNRIGNVFDLAGPSFTINTACSSSVYAVHHACHSLRARDCDAALVGGVNLILTVDQHMNTAKLGVLSPTSFCHTFDASADGYGRGEGAGALYLKRLSDAVRDGDVIRSVIRSSAVNTNGKVPGYGITYPNVKGQEKVIRAAYKRANLDPNKTAYFECHGTGTSVGDPIEVKAVSNAMNDTRDSDRPLLIGSVKANIGHSEAASGIFAVMKATLMVEAGVVPGVAGLQTVNPLIPERDLNVKVNKDTAPWPQGFESRRASVSSFGYGGTNGHVIIENVQALEPDYQQGARKHVANYNHASSRALLLTFSAHDKATLLRNIDAHAAVADQYYLADFAHTLNAKRTQLQQRAFTIATEGYFSVDDFKAAVKTGSASKPISNLCFVFTGQGAQWAGVGKDAIESFPVFRETIRKLDRVLKATEHPPSFSLEEELCAPAESSRINNADVAQPTLVAVQIAITDLLASWDIVPAATIGHSAGEYAAAYAAGVSSAPEIIIAAYYRGYSLGQYAPTGGSMLAVGKGPDEIGLFKANIDESLVVACENSPNSVTLSGSAEAIRQAKDFFVANDIFARELRTGMAYHSPQMQPVAGRMIEHVKQAWRRLDSFDRQWRRPRVVMMSSVINEIITDKQITAEYWALNLTSPVRFSSAVAKLATTEGFDRIGGLVEVGPHSALAGPLKQICQANGLTELAYIPSLIRNADGVRSLLETAGNLYLRDFPVNLRQVNKVNNPVRSPGATKVWELQPFTLSDLPPYQWNYEKMFWAEPRVSAEYRQLTHARHDLLGSKLLGLSTNAAAWRNILRLSDVPWLQDHKLGGSIMFPAAGHMALAIEAVRQHCDNNSLSIAGVTLRNFALKTALIVPDNADGIEIQLRLLAAGAQDQPGFNFAVESFSNHVWTMHSEGVIEPILAESAQTIPPHSLKLDALTQRHTGRKWNDAFRRVGFEYGPSFDCLDKIRTKDGIYEAAGDIPIATPTRVMADESRYILHPSIVDNLLQLCIVSIHAGAHQTMPWGVVPVKFEELTLLLTDDVADHVGKAIAWNPVRGEKARHFNTNAQLATSAGRVILDIKGLHTLAYEAALPPPTEAVLAPLPYCGTLWQPDLSLSVLRNVLQQDKNPGSVFEAVLHVLALLNHSSSPSSALVVDTESTFNIAAVVNHLPTAEIHLVGNDSIGDLPRCKALNVADKPSDPSLWNLEAQDLLLLGTEDTGKLINTGSFSTLKKSMVATGSIICLIDHQYLPQALLQAHEAGLTATDVTFQDRTLLFCHQNRYESTVEKVRLVYSRRFSAAPQALEIALTQQRIDVIVQDLDEAEFDTAGEHIIFYNPSGNVLLQPEQKTFEALKKMLLAGASVTWLTSGVNEGKCASAALVPGFLRVVREEQKMAKFTWLDLNAGEKFPSIAKITGAIINGQSDERELWLKNGICYVSRVVPSTELINRVSSSTENPTKETLPKGVLLCGEFEGAELVFKHSDALETTPLGAGLLEIQVQNIHHDSPPSSPAVDEPTLVSGTVIKTGQDIASNLLGKVVLAYTPKPYDTIVRVAASLCAECEPTMAQRLVMDLPDLSRVYNILSATPSSIERKHVLLISDSPTVLAAFEKMAKLLEFQLTVLLEGKSQEQAQVSASETATRLYASDRVELAEMMAKAGSSLVVAAFSFSHLSQQIWRSIPSGASFLLDQKEALSVPLDTDPFSRGAHFATVSLASSFQARPESLGSVLRCLATALSRDDEAKSLKITSIALLQDNESKVSDHSVLSYNYDVDLVKLHPSEFQLRFSADATYLLVGCLGGLGRSLTHWMMQRGAKHFAFISRSAADKPEAAHLIKSMEEAGAVTQVFRGDAGKPDDVARAIKSIPQDKPIKGVVHAAMVLQDGMIGPNMTVDKFKACLAPKVDGAQVLHNALKDCNLDFFVMTSSISATVGQPGQSNYAAANSYLDNLAWQRNLMGLPATSLVLPMVLGVGVVAENDGLEEKISGRGMYGVEEDEMLRGFEAAMSQPVLNGDAASLAHSTIIMGLDPARLAHAMAAAGEHGDVSWIGDTRFSNLRPLIGSALDGSKKAGAAGSADFSAQAAELAATGGYDAAILLVAEKVMERCGRILMVPVEDFELDGRSIGAYGLDSMIGAQLRNWLFKEFGLNIAFQDLLATTLTFKGLAAAILTVFGVAAQE